MIDRMQERQPKRNSGEKVISFVYFPFNFLTVLFRRMGYVKHKIPLPYAAASEGKKGKKRKNQNTIC